MPIAMVLLGAVVVITMPMVTVVLPALLPFDVTLVAMLPLVAVVRLAMVVLPVSVVLVTVVLL